MYIDINTCIHTYIYTYIHKSIKSCNDKKNYVYDVKYINIYTSCYNTRSHMAGIA